MVIVLKLPLFFLHLTFYVASSECFVFRRIKFYYLIVPLRTYNVDIVINEFNDNPLSIFDAKPRSLEGAPTRLDYYKS